MIIPFLLLLPFLIASLISVMFGNFASFYTHICTYPLFTLFRCVNVLYYFSVRVVIFICDVPKLQFSLIAKYSETSVYRTHRTSLYIEVLTNPHGHYIENRFDGELIPSIPKFTQLILLDNARI